MNANKVVPKWVKRLGMESWEWKCDWKTPATSDNLEVEDYASIAIDKGSRDLKIELNKDNKEGVDERVIVHELCHVFFESLDIIFKTVVNRIVTTKKDRDAFIELFGDVLESEVDAVTWALLKAWNKGR